VLTVGQDLDSHLVYGQSSSGRSLSPAEFFQLARWYGEWDWPEGHRAVEDDSHPGAKQSAQSRSIWPQRYVSKSHFAFL